MSNRGRAIGIGGVFFKCQDPAAMREWYSTHLGFKAEQYGAMFEFGTGTGSEKGYTVWSPFAANSGYFKPSEKDFMVNFRVENIEALVEQLKAAGIDTLEPIAAYEYGKFAHIMDPEGNKIELWEP